jgi:surface polysaccharide O-acyltransferase-like enzyme
MTRRLLVLNGIAVIGAVANHTVGWGFTSLFWWTDRYQAVTVPDFSQLGGSSYYALRALEQLVTFSLPAFLFVSGFFVAFAAGREATVGWGKLRGRLKTLLIPYLLWSLAIFAFRGLDGAADTPGGYAQQLLFGRAAIPYYYIPLITQLFLLSPLIVLGLKWHWRVVLLGAALLQAIVQLARYSVLLGRNDPIATWVWDHAPGWFFPTMVFWFVFGTFAGLNGAPFRQWLSQRKPMLPWLTLGFGILGVMEWELLLRVSGQQWLNPTPTLVDSLYSGAVILTFLALADVKVPARRQLDVLGERSFGIYLVHAPVLELLSRAVYHVAPPLLGNQMVFQSVLIVVGVGVPVLLMAIVRRSPARPCYNYLFG